MTLLALLLALAGFALFGIATPAQHVRRIGGYLLPGQQRRLRICAWLAIVAAFGPAIAERGWIFGPVLWLGALMLGATAAFLLLNLLPARPARRARHR